MDFPPFTRAELGRLTRIVGRRLTGADYQYLPDGAEDSPYVGGDHVDGDLIAVRLAFDDDALVFTWATLGWVEGLSIVPEPRWPLADHGAVHDAASRPAWADHLGGVVVSIGGAWQLSGVGPASESLWSVRLDFQGGSVVMALGGVDGALRYVPDELVVISERSLAVNYAPDHVGESAWGAEL